MITYITSSLQGCMWVQAQFMCGHRCAAGCELFLLDSTVTFDTAVVADAV